MTSEKKNEKNGFWYGKNVLITGGNGFVAANLALKLIELDANVHITVRNFSDYNTIKMLAKRDVEYITEITDMSIFGQIESIFVNRKIDTIFHLAASAIVKQASENPTPTLNNNIIPTINILEAARKIGIPRIVVASSDKAYGNHATEKDSEPLPYVESHALRGLDVYSTSKVCADMICQAMALQFDQHIMITRCSNIYGPGDLNFTRLIPGTIMRILSGESPVINKGNEQVLREYMYVDDIVAAYLFLAEYTDRYYAGKHPVRGDTAYGWSCFNIGSYNSDVNTELKWAEPELPNIKNPQVVIKLISDSINKKDLGVKELEFEEKPKAESFIEIPNQYLDSKKLLNFAKKMSVSLPKTELTEGLEKTIEWYYANSKFLRRRFWTSCLTGAVV